MNELRTNNHYISSLLELYQITYKHFSKNFLLFFRVSVLGEFFELVDFLDLVLAVGNKYF